MTAPERVKSPKIRRSVREKWTIALMLGVPAMIVIGLVWIPTVFTVILSFARWDGIGGTSSIEWIGPQNYVDAVQAYPPFQQALQNNVLWLVFLFLVPTVIGILLAILLDKNLKGSRLYQSIFYIPVVLSMALIGFIWQLIYSTEGGVLNSLLGTDVDWLGDPDINIWAVMVAAGWRHTGYIMLLYLAGLKAIDPSVREAAVMDGATTLQIFRLVYLPLMMPSLVAIGTYAVLLAWNEYLYAFLLLSNDRELTLPVALGNFLAADDSPWELLMTTGFIYALPPAAIYYAFRRYMVGGLTAGAVKS